MEFLIILIGAIFVNNVVLTQFLGICPFIGVSNKVETSLGMAGAVTFVIVIATIVTFLIQKFVLDALIAALVQMVEIILKKVSPSLYQALGIFLPLITTNCAVLGVAILTIQKEYDLIEGVVYATGISLGFGLALLIFAGIREQLDLMNIPKPMKGAPIALVVAGLLALAFMGFTGIV